MPESILEVRNLKKRFALHKGLLGRFSKSAAVAAVDDISFHIRPNETLGLVGESGCGKTTTGKAILKLTDIDEGSIIYNGEDITSLSSKQFRPYRSEMQMIFQDLDAALNPKMRIRDTLREAVRLHNRELGRDDVDRKVAELLDLVNLKKNKLDSFPGELSGGEKRRVGIARVLAVEPRFLVADEPTSALDVSIQAQVINLMRDLQDQLGLSYLFISHDLQLVELVSHRVAVMYLGRVVEMGPAKDIVSRPRHPYTAVLWSSLVEKENKEANGGTTVNAEDFERPTSGCRFAPRCPIYEKMGRPAACTDPDNEPALKETGKEHTVACHFPL